MSGLIEDIRALISASVFSLWRYVVWLRCMKKMWPHVDMWLESGDTSILIVSSDCCECSWILHQLCVSGTFLKVSCNVQSELSGFW